ncbi:MAG: hypothetical protein ACN6O2_01220 [Stenotrophomonas sp.]
MLASFLQGQNAGLANREYRTQQANKSRLSELAPQIMAGDPSAYSQAVAIDPKAAQGYQDAGDAQLRKLQGFIKYVDGARARGNPAAVDAALRQGGPFIQQITGKAPPTTWTADMEPGWEELKARVAMVGAPSGEQDQFTLGPGSKRFDATGNVVAEVPFAPANGNIVTVPDGAGGSVQMVWDPRTRQLNPLPQVGGQAYEDGSPVSVTSGTGPDGTPFNFDPNMPAADRAAAMADMASGGSLTTATLPSRSVTPQQFAGGGRLGYTPPKPEISAAEQQRLDMARDAAARADRAEARADRSEQRQIAANSVSGRTPNEGERNASGFYQRMVAANADLQRLTDAGYDPTNLRDHLTVGSAVGNFLASNEGQQYNQAAMNWVRANLRKESGAAIGVDEARQEIRNYFPQPGDTPDVVQQKAKNRLVVEQAMLQAAGRAAPPQAGQRPLAPDRQQSNAIPQRARNPQTGQVIELRNGQWVPVQ